MNVCNRKIISALVTSFCLSASGFAESEFESTLISLKDLPPVKEARMVIDMSRQLIEDECLYNSANSFVAINKKTFTLPATVFEYITEIECDTDYTNLVVNAANDTTELGTAGGANPVVAAKISYAAGTGQTASKSFYLVAVGSDGKAIQIDTGATVGDEIPQNGSVIYDYCIALDSGNGGTWFLWTLGSTAAVAGTNTNVRDISSAIGHEFCIAAQ